MYLNDKLHASIMKSAIKFMICENNFTSYHPLFTTILRGTWRE